MQKTPLIKFLPIIFLFMEIAGFVIVGNWIGVLPTLFLILATTVLGIFVLRVQGFLQLRKMQQQMASGQYPAQNMLDNTLMMFGGLLLVIPGFITDTIGLLLLIPPIRILLFRWFIKKGLATTTKPDQHTIDGEYRREK